MHCKIIYSDDHAPDDIARIKELFKNNITNLTNYEVDNWENFSNSFFYVFLTEQRFSKDNGGVVLITDGDKLCGISGFNVSSLDPNVYILGVRTIVDRAYRNKLLMSTYFIPEQLKQVSGKAKLVIFLFDTDNKFSLYTVFVTGKLNALLQNRLGDFSDLWGNLQSVPFPIKINHVFQNALYIKIDTAFVFDWELLKENHAQNQ